MLRSVSPVCLAFVAELDARDPSHEFVDCEGVHIFRHHPGAGSRAMAWLVDPRYLHCIFDVRWHGRAGAIGFRGEAPDGSAVRLWLVGWHGGHDDAWLESAADMTALARDRPRDCSLVICGDWNVDMLPTLSADPFVRDREGRHDDHTDLRLFLEGFLEDLNVQVSLPGVVCGSPGDPFAAEALVAPFSRVPVGANIERELPALLDYVAASAPVDVTVDWRICLSDHAAILFELGDAPVLPRRPRRVWRCGDELGMALKLTEDLPASHAADVASIVQDTALEYADRSSAASHRRLRVPMQVRDLFAKAASSDDPRCERKCRREAWQLLRHHICERDSTRVGGLVRKGGVPSRSKKLYDFLGLEIEDVPGEKMVIRDADEIARRLDAFVYKRWGCGQFHRLDRILDFLERWEGVLLDFEDYEFREVFKRMKRINLLDNRGEAVEMWCRAFQCCPAAVVAHFNLLASSRRRIEQFFIIARSQGKSSPTPALSSIRFIMPLPAQLSILDALLANRVHRFMASECPLPYAAFAGAVPKTQVLDITFALTMLSEKALDCHSQGAAAQFDIAQFYDNMDVLRSCEWLLDKGLPGPVCAALLRVQWLPSLAIRAGAACIKVPRRAFGAITGSRVAGALGRVPVEAAMCKTVPEYSRLGFPTNENGRRFLYASFVDNIFVFGASLGGAVSAADALAHELKSSWSLDVKANSRLVMSALGDDARLPSTSVWRQVRLFPALGSIISDDNSLWPCWWDFHRVAWKAFFANLCRPAVRRRPLREKLRIMTRSARSVFDFRCSRWPWTTNAARYSDSTQKRMVAILLDLRRAPGESVEAFVSRRSRLACAACRSQGWWSERHRQRVISWREHMRRPANADSPAAKILSFRDAAWLQGRREAVGSASRTAGCLELRRISHVSAR